MEHIPFNNLRRVEEIIDRVEMEDLVLIFSQATGDRYLLVYNTKRAPEGDEPLWKAMRLAGLRSSDYEDFNGIVVGLPAVDMILPDIPTRGIRFYSIEHTFRKKGDYRKLERTCYRLATTLFEHLKKLSHSERNALSGRCVAKIIQLALPAILSRHPIENLVAVLPSPDIAEFLKMEEQSYQLIYNDPEDLERMHNDLQLLDDHIVRLKPQWLAGFEELSLYISTANTDLGEPTNLHGFLHDCFIDLRPILRRMGEKEKLKETCRGLARRCWGEWEKSNAASFRSAAYSLTAESWLADEDVEDLIALFPSDSFKGFVETGDAQRVYRAPRPSGPSLSTAGYSVQDLSSGQVPTGRYDKAPILSFSVLAPVFKQGHDVLDLGLVLWKAGQSAELGRTLWMLSRDLLERPKSEWLQTSAWIKVNASPGVITDLAIRAALIYGLSDPWQWREGRHHIFLQKCYAHVLDSLLNQEKRAATKALAYYWKALRIWFGWFLTDSKDRSLYEMVVACANFHHSCENRADLEEEWEIASRLIEIGETITAGQLQHRTYRQDHRDESREHSSTPAYLREVVESRMSINRLLLSKPFERELHKYYAAHAKWREIQETISGGTISGRPYLESLDRLLGDYRRLRRIAYAPAHEMAVLHSAYAEDIQRIENLKRGVETGPTIRITLRNPWVTEGVRERLVFEVENIGGAAANQFKLEMDRAAEFEFLSAPAALALDEFAPGRRRRLEYDIRVKGASLALCLSYGYKDHRGRQQTNQERLFREVRLSPEKGIKPKGNRYEVGRYVSNSRRFFGRRAELEQILSRLVGGSTQPIVVRGPRRIGKTSLMHQLELALEQPQELRRLGLEAEVETQLRPIHPLFVSLQAISETGGNSIALFLQMLFEEVCAALSLKSSAFQLSKALAQSFPARLFQKQVSWVFEQRPHERLLVLIDEWDEVYREEHSELGRNLRYLLQEEQRISWVFSSTWLLTKEGGEFGSPFFNMLFTLEVKEMDWESAVRLVTEPSKEVGVEWRGEAVVAVLEQSGRRPYLIQLICSKITDYLIQNSSNEVDTDAVAVVTNNIMTQAQTTVPYFGPVWQDYDLERYDQGGEKHSVRWMGRLILWALDASNSKSLTGQEVRNYIESDFKRHSLRVPDKQFFSEEFEDQLTKLRDIFDVLTEENRRFTFAVPLMQLWLHQRISQQADFIRQAHTGLVHDYETRLINA